MFYLYYNYMQITLSKTKAYTYEVVKSLSRYICEIFFFHKYKLVFTYETVLLTTLNLP